MKILDTIQVFLLIILAISFLFLLRHNYHINEEWLTISKEHSIVNHNAAKSAALKNYYNSNIKSNYSTTLTTQQQVVIEKIISESNQKEQLIQKLIKDLNAADSKIKLLESSSSNDNSKSLQNFDILSESLNRSNSASNTLLALDVANSKLQSMCERRFGIQLIDEWRKSEQLWCSDNEETNPNLKSDLKCYPYQQEHKKFGDRGPDMFCVATNFFIDFSKVKGSSDPPPAKKRPLGSNQYYSFETGSIYSTCRKTAKWNSDLFMPHLHSQMSSFESDQAPSMYEDSSKYIVEERPTYLLARDEDCENTFHHTADLLSPQSSQLQMMYFDQHPDGPYKEFVGKVYAPFDNTVQRPSKYNNKIVLFRQVVFHLESPAGLIFPKVTNPDPNRCFSTSLFQSYRKYALHMLKLYDVPPPVIPSITLTLRKRSEHKNVGRVMANEKEVIDVLNKGNMMDVKIVDFAKMNFIEQITLVRNTNILIGIHGAGLMLIMFAAEEAVLIEIHPSYRQDRHFRHAARMTGKYYMAVRAHQRESCVGSSDTITVPVNDFTVAVDGAVRLARTFDKGLVECGAVCPTEILAIDNRLDKYYKTSKGERKGRSIDLSFPCAR